MDCVGNIMIANQPIWHGVSLLCHFPATVLHPRHWAHLGPEWGETKEGFRCTNKKNSVPRNPKLKWLAAIDKERYPPSYLLGHIKVLVLDSGLQSLFG